MIEKRPQNYSSFVRPVHNHEPAHYTKERKNKGTYVGGFMIIRVAVRAYSHCAATKECEQSSISFVCGHNDDWR